MEANQVFNKMLYEIEHSKLNYMITRRTPFSASISLKSSFIQFFDHKSTNETHETGSEQLKNLELETSEQKARIYELDRIVEQQKEVIEEEREKLNNHHEVKKEKDKNADIEIAKLREELLAVKKEKHNLNTNLKLQKDETEALKKETVDLRRVSEKLESKLVKTIDALETKTKDVDDLKKGNDDLELILEKTKADLSKFKLVKQTDVQPLFECSDCGSRLQSYKSLKQHIVSEHCRNKATQNDQISNFEEYPCYYCDKIIVSTSDLEKHVTSCDEVIRMIEEYEFPCDVCDTSCTSKEQLEQHIASYHYTYYTEEDLKTCDFCGIEFGTLGGLRNHIRSQHKEMLPN